MRTDVDVKVRINGFVNEKVKEDCFDSLQKASEVLLTIANNTVPKDDGILKASGKTSGDITIMTTAVSYDTPYAVRLHENPQYDFQGNGRGKWLELTLAEQKDNIKRLLADEIAERLKQSFLGGGST